MNKTALLNIKVIPNSSKNSVVEFAEGVFKIKISAQPKKGKANKELIKFISKELKIPKSKISIKSGETSRIKNITIEGLTSGEAIQALSPTEVY